MEKEKNKTGKCYSKVNQGQRNKDDDYQTPYSMTRQFIDKYKDFFDFTLPVLEPAAGKGAMVKVLQQYFKTVKAIQYPEFDFLKPFDFVAEKPAYIIGNPPFIHAGAFIQQAGLVAQKAFAFLLPQSYFSGQQRFSEKIFTGLNGFYLTNIETFTRYPMLSDEIRDDGKYITGMQVYAWYIWKKEYKEKTCVDLISNQQYVIKQSDDTCKNCIAGYCCNPFRTMYTKDGTEEKKMQKHKLRYACSIDKTNHWWWYVCKQYGKREEWGETNEK